MNNGTIILDNVNIHCYLDFNIKYLFKIVKIKKLIIKNSSLIGRNLFETINNNTQIIITNSFINGNIESHQHSFYEIILLKILMIQKLLLNKQNKVYLKLVY